VKFIDMCF